MDVDPPAVYNAPLVLPVTTGFPSGLPITFGQPQHTRLPKRKQPDVEELCQDPDTTCLPDLEAAPLVKSSRPTPDALVAIPVDRLVKVQFSEGNLVDGKIIFREALGVLVMILSEHDSVDAPVGSRWWAKTTALFAPGTSYRIVQAIHPTG